MSLRGRRPPRPDAWSDAHARARARAAERLDEPLDATESAWLDEHLASCDACRAVADSYAAQRLGLRALADQTPVPPRDLWARTAAAIESEAGFRDRTARGRGRRSLLAPYALLSAALVVAVVVGTLTSSQHTGGGGPAASAGPSDGAIAARSSGTNPGATPLIVPPQRVEWISKDQSGAFSLRTSTVDQVCPAGASPCDTSASTDQRPVDLNVQPQTVIGSPEGDQFIVVADSGSTQTGTVSVVRFGPVSPSPSPAAAPTPTPTPTTAGSTPPASPTPTLIPVPTSTPTPTPVAATPTPTPVGPPPSGSPVATPTPSVEISPSPSSGEPVQIAHDVIVIGQTAAYAPSGNWFAFSARPADGSVGPDIYLWRVGEAQAHPITSDHRSELGGWTGEIIVGSTAVETADATVGASFLLDPTTTVQTFLPQAGNAWRPSVDPSGRLAVYWTGQLRATTDRPGFAPEAGRLVLAAWGTGTAAPSDGPVPTAPRDQANDRHETTIAAGKLADWDARWDTTGTKLAVWIADAADPSFGRLSLYSVDAFDGRIDLKKPLLDAAPAKAGYALSDGQLVWVEPTQAPGADTGPIHVLAWTDQGSGTVETIPQGQAVVIR